VQSNRFLMTVAVMAATIMQVLDTTIMNVALPHMAGELGATVDNISWVLTSYLVASSILMPLTGYFTDRLGRNRYLLISIGGFVIASGLCGIATGLYEMVIFRFLQGMFGASLVPLSQAIMVQSFPAKERGKAMAIWGMGIMVAPILGPTLGGYLTEVISWRWTFYINLPVGVLSFLLAARYVPTTEVKERSMDWFALISLGISVGALQLVLDRGQFDDWFSSRAIVAETAVAALAFAAFLWHSAQSRAHPLFDLAVFKDRNFALACLLMATIGLGMFGGMFLQPLFLETMLDYPTMAAGLAVMPRGIGTFFSMSLAGRLLGRGMSPKRLVLPGVLVSMYGSYMMAGFNAQVTYADFIVPLLLQGFGMGLIFVPLSTLAFSTLPARFAAEAAGIYSLVRSIGAAVGISMVSNFFTRTAQAQWTLLRGHINPFNPALQAYLAPLHLQPRGQGIALLAQATGLQAQLTAFISSFWMIAASFLLMVPLVLLLKESPHAPGPAAPAPTE
jgi:DHA2 family multidrug resistance protein